MTTGVFLIAIILLLIMTVTCGYFFHHMFRVWENPKAPLWLKLAYPALLIPMLVAVQLFIHIIRVLASHKP